MTSWTGGLPLSTGDIELIDESEVASASRRFERTEVVAKPLPPPWTANPLVIMGGLLAAFTVGAGLVFLLVRTMMQPTLRPQPIQAGQVPQAVTAPAPVVTPLPALPRVKAAPTASVVPTPARKKPAPAAAVRRHAAPAKPAPAKPAKKRSAGGNAWVDPFAQ